jgi:hypothetical protein
MIQITTTATITSIQLETCMPTIDVVRLTHFMVFPPIGLSTRRPGLSKISARPLSCRTARGRNWLTSISTMNRGGGRQLGYSPAMRQGVTAQVSRSVIYLNGRFLLRHDGWRYEFRPFLVRRDGHGGGFGCRPRPRQWWRMTASLMVVSAGTSNVVQPRGKVMRE